jgi:GntR family transcriptional regulator of vanillate catabolism
VSQDSIHIVTRLRKLILDGRYAPGARIAEIPVAEELGVSRTPVRLAFRTLEQEGLLQRAGARGFVVRQFSEEDVLCGLEVRGVLEGLAARRLAERGMSAPTRLRLQECLGEGAALLSRGVLTEQSIAGWSELNLAFHQTIVGATDSTAIADAIARNNHLPFASSDSIIIDHSALDREFQKLHFAQLQHVLIFEALSGGESARAEMLMREHAYVGLRYGKLFGLEGASAIAVPPPALATAPRAPKPAHRRRANSA